MSGSEPRVLRAMVGALREQTTPELEWDALEARLMARIDAIGPDEPKDRVEENSVALRGELSAAEVLPVRVEASERSRGAASDRPRSRGGAPRWIPLVAASLLVAAGVWAAARTGDERVLEGPPPLVGEVEAVREPALGSQGRVSEQRVEAPELEASLPVLEPDLPRASHGAPPPRSQKPLASPSSERVETAPPAALDAARTSVTEAELRGRIEGCFSTVALPEAGRDGVSVGVRSTLRLQVAEDGSVVQAQFEPPLKPELQRCALFVLASRLGPGARTIAIPVRAR